MTEPTTDMDLRPSGDALLQVTFDPSLAEISERVGAKDRLRDSGVILGILAPVVKDMTSLPLRSERLCSILEAALLHRHHLTGWTRSTRSPLSRMKTRYPVPAALAQRPHVTHPGQGEFLQRLLLLAAVADPALEITDWVRFKRASTDIRVAIEDRKYTRAYTLSKLTVTDTDDAGLARFRSEVRILLAKGEAGFDRVLLNSILWLIDRILGVHEEDADARPTSSRRAPRVSQAGRSHQSDREDRREAEPPIRIPLPAAKSGEHATEFQVKLEELAGSYILAQEANWCPYNVRTLDPHERKTLAQLLQTHDAMQDADRLNLLLGLLVVTGLSVEELLDLTLGEDGELTPDGRYLRRVPLPPASFRPKPGLEYWYRLTHADRFYVRLPRKLRKLLASALDKGHRRTLGEALGIPIENATALTRELGALLRRNGQPRVGVDHLKRALRDAIGMRTGDADIARLITGRSDGRMPIALGYRACAVADLARICEEEMASLYCEPPEVEEADHGASTVGGRCLPDLVLLSGAVAKSVRMTRELFTANACTLIEKHNAYTLYVARLLTMDGRRPVHDLVAYRGSRGAWHTVVEDKASTERHACRPEILPPLIREQYDHYVAHLRSLAHELLKDPETAEMGRAVADLVRLPYQEGMLPFLFFLSDDGTRAICVSESTLKERDPAWPFPPNLSRHLLATQLDRLGVLAHFIRLQLGHLAPGETHIGEASALSLEDARRALEAPIQKVLTQLGWVALAGPLPPRRLPAVEKGAKRYIHSLLGPDDRARTRKEKRLRMLDRLDKVLPDIPKGLSRQQALDWANREMVRRTSDDPGIKEAYEKLLPRYLSSRKGQGYGLRPPSQYAWITPEYPEFWRDQPHLSTIADKVRVRTIGELALANRSYQAKRRNLLSVTVSGAPGTAPDDTVYAAASPPAARRTAELILCASLYGACFDVKRLRSLIDARTADAFELIGCVALGARDVHAPTLDRWIADDLSSALLARPGQGETPSRREVENELRRLLGKVAPGLDVKDPIRITASLGRAYWRTHLSGFLFAYADGTHEPTALSPATLARVLDNRRSLHTSKEPLPEPEAPHETKVPTLSVGLADTRLAYQGLLDLITEILESKAHGQDHSKPAHLRRFIQNHAQAYGTGGRVLPGALGLVADWLVRLAEDSLAGRRKLVLPSLERYLIALKRLIELADGLDLTQLSGIELGDLYQKMIEACPATGQVFIGRRLVDFHGYLVREHFVETVGWSFLPRDVSRPADANVLSDREYRLCLKKLYEDEHVTKDDKILQAALLILAYRFGLRAGEAVRLRNDDLTLVIDERVIVDVENNIYGHTKSPAGVRRIPLIGVLDNHEKEILISLKQMARSHSATNDTNPALFTDPDDPRALYKCDRLFRRIHECLRNVTADPTIRYHHLRHSFGTRLILGLIGDQYDSPAVRRLTLALFGSPVDHASLRIYLTGSPEVGPLTFRTITDLMGHASIGTTIKSYIHVMEFLLKAACDLKLPVIPATAEAYVLLEHTGNCDKRRERDTTNGPTPGVMLPKGWPYPVEPLHIPPAQGRPRALSTLKTPVLRADAKKVLWVLQRLKAGSGGHDVIANKVVVDIDVVRKIDAEWTRYQYAAPRSHGTSLSREGFLSPRDTPTGAMARERGRLEESLTEAGAMIKTANPIEMGRFLLGLDAWFGSRHPTKRLRHGGRSSVPWRFGHVDTLAAFLYVLNFLGTPSHRQSVRREGKYTKEGIKGLDKMLSRYGIKSQPGARKEGVRQLEVAFTTKGVTEESPWYAYHVTLDHMLEVLYIGIKAGILGVRPAEVSELGKPTTWPLRNPVNTAIQTDPEDPDDPA